MYVRCSPITSLLDSDHLTASRSDGAEFFCVHAHRASSFTSQSPHQQVSLWIDILKINHADAFNSTGRVYTLPVWQITSNPHWMVEQLALVHCFKDHERTFSALPLGFWTTAWSKEEEGRLEMSAGWCTNGFQSSWYPCQHCRSSSR